MTEFSELIGKTIARIDGKKGDDVLLIACTDGTRYKQYHSQDCCETVQIEDIVGDLDDIVGSPVLSAEEVTFAQDETPDNVPPPEYPDESFTWTFYKLATIKGSVTIRWYGSSNGYYSESVDFVKD